ncbi:MAG: serine/threonine protein kinase [Gemmataceae bacterium]|nr:serine/threonine protein kinase [Gemmataceae bacterium]MCI0741446.1 serine/threonine protein kinase [Gemmataceae bacterium]
MKNLDDMLVELEMRNDEGLPTAPDLASQSPELAEALNRRLNQLHKVEWLLFEGLNEPLDDTLPQVQAPTIDGYTIEHALGAGGMGCVYLARNHELNRLEAIKILRSTDKRQSPDDQNRLAKRFRREAQTLASLRHENIVSVYQGRPRDDTPYFAMEYLPRGSLAQDAERRRLTDAGPRAVVAFMIKVARAVQHAHEQRVLHRDLKPGNILLDDHGEPMVSDFGLAKLLDPASDSDEAGVANLGQVQDSAGPSLSTAVSLPGQQPGTPGYMAPEQHDPSRGPVSCATDMWALGVVLYELLFGQRPFLGQGGELRDNILNAPAVLPRTLPGGVNLRLGQIVLRCLNKTPELRFASAGDLTDALQDWLKNHEVGQQPGWRRALHSLRRHPVKTAVAGVLAGGLLVFALYLLLRSPSDSNDLNTRWREMHSDMKKDEPVTLIPAKGEPRYAKWAHQSSGQTELDANGYFTIRCWKIALLELAQEVPWEEYRLRCKFRHDSSLRDGTVGLYFAHQSAPSTHGRAHFLYQVCYNDIIKKADLFRKVAKPPPVIPDTNATELIPTAYAELGSDELWKSHFGVSHVAKFEPVGNVGDRGGRWRDLVVEVRRHEIHVSFDDSGTEVLNLARVQNELDQAFQKQLREDPARYAFFGAFQPTFHRHGSLGVIVKGGVVAVAECVLEPL